MTDDNFKPETYPAYWLGRLPAAMAVAASEPEPEEARSILRGVLEEYLKSPVPSEFVRSEIQKEMQR